MPPIDPPPISIINRPPLLSWRRPLIIILIITIILILAVYYRDGIVSISISGISALVNLGPVLGTLLFTITFAIATVILLSGSVLSLVGASVFSTAFGPFIGALLCTCAVFIGGSIGAIIAFILGRRVFRHHIEKWADIEGRVNRQIIDRAIGQHGFKMVAMLRLSPLIPFVLFNYTMGLTAISIGEYSMACIGMLPGVIIESMIGSSLATIASNFTGNVPVGDHQIAVLVLLIGGTTLALLTTCYVSVVVRRKIKALMNENPVEVIQEPIQ